MRRLVLALCLFLAARSAVAATPIPLVFPVSARILDSRDEPVNATLRIAYAVYRTPEGGSAVWSATWNVPVQDGYFAVMLGDGTDLAPGGTVLGADVFAPGVDAFLGISVDGAAELSPRIRLSSVPYAYLAQRALDADTLLGETPATLRDASKLTGAAPLAVLGEAVAAAKAYTDGAAATTLSSAKSYADAVGDDTLASAKSHADGAAGTALADAKTYADGIGVSAVASAKGYSDTVGTNTLTAAKSHADTGDTNTLAAAKTHANTGDAATLTSAKSYADTGDTTTLNNAKSYADTGDTTTLNNAKSYADTADTTTLNNAKTYADNRLVVSYPTSCAALKTADSTLPSGVYTVRPTGAQVAFQVYCDMTTEGGGWTLVWSNLRGFSSRHTTSIPWAHAVNTTPLYNRPLSWSLERFEVYTGLRWWSSLGPNGQFRYDWANDYGSAIDQRIVCTGFSFNASQQYRLNVGSCTQKVGSTTAGITTSEHNGQRFTATDADYDQASNNCANNYSATPFWYGSCWSGSINGGGESSGSGYYNGAYWTSSAVAWGSDNGSGAGNGWMWVK